MGLHAHSMALPRPKSGHFVDDSPAFHQQHDEEICYTTPKSFNWVENSISRNCPYLLHTSSYKRPL